MFYLYSLKLRAWYCGGTLRGLKFTVYWGNRNNMHMQLAVFRDRKDAEDTATGLTNAENGVVMVRPLSIEVDNDNANFLKWIADRLVYQHGENPNVDFVLKLRQIAKIC